MIFIHNEEECVVCLEEDAVPNVIFSPCNHMVCCQPCAYRLLGKPNALCPVCRSSIGDYVNICDVLEDPAIYLKDLLPGYKVKRGSLVHEFIVENLYLNHWQEELDDLNLDNVFSAQGADVQVTRRIFAATKKMLDEWCAKRQEIVKKYSK